MKALISAIKLLTIIPIDTRNRIEPGRMEWTLLCFPLVGMLLGGICAGVLWLAVRVFPPGIAAALAILALVVVTGALHVDGLADTADGLFGGATRERKLEIMRDTRVGTFGIVAIAFLLGIKVLALASVAASTKDSRRGILVLFMTPVVGRWLILLAAGVCAYAREGEGTGRAAVDAARPSHFLVWLLPAALLAWLCLGVGGLLMLAAVLAVVFAAILCVKWKLGGMTGDTLGGVCEVGEMLFLLSFFIATG
ncbi:MAG: adenosylcobinamide-GDP ribazoletransferase [Planctomycetes bacterium]|nr:adenosylcobinamide-GDP ribazoletransferase [Planctomycetota bacterium]